MADQIVLDLGDDYGEIAITPIAAAEDEGLLEAASMGESVETIKVKLQDVLAGPLTGMGMALRSALPKAQKLDNDTYKLDEFSAEFQIGLEKEVGVDIGVVAKIIPSGSFSCTYTWKRIN